MQSILFNGKKTLSCEYPHTRETCEKDPGVNERQVRGWGPESLLSVLPDFAKWKWKSLSRCQTLQPHGLYSPWNSSGQNTGVSSLSFLQGIFPTQGSNPGLPHCRWILYQLGNVLIFKIMLILPFFFKDLFLLFPLLSLYFCSSTFFVLALVFFIRFLELNVRVIYF